MRVPRVFGINFLAIKAQLIGIVSAIGLLIGAFFSVKRMGKKEYKARVAEENHKGLIQDIERMEKVENVQIQESKNAGTANDEHDYLVEQLHKRGEIEQ